MAKRQKIMVKIPLSKQWHARWHASLNQQNCLHYRAFPRSRFQEVPVRRYTIISNIVLTLAIFAQGFPQAGGKPANQMPNRQPSPAPKKHPFTFEDMMALKRVGGPVVSPDGKWVLFAAVDVSLKENKKTSHLWAIPMAGGEARQLTADPGG